MEVLRINLKKCNLSEDMARDRSEWRNRIHVVDPLGFYDDNELPLDIPITFNITNAQLHNTYDFHQVSLPSPNKGGRLASNRQSTTKTFALNGSCT